MKRPALVVLVLILALALVTAGATSLAGGGRHAAVAARVFTVAQVRTVMAHNPKEWAGGAVLVRGRLVVMVFDCPYMGRFWCPTLQWVEIDPDAPGPQPLLVTLTPANPLLAAIRRLPLLGRFIPTTGPLHEGPGIFRIRLRAAPRCPFPSANPSCANAVLLAPEH